MHVSTPVEVSARWSGVTGAWFGTIPAVVLGGVESIVVVALWAWLFPEPRKVDQLTAKELRPATEQVLETGTPTS
jgi:hypothetical protein